MRKPRQWKVPVTSQQRRQGAGFDFTGHMRVLCRNIVGRLRELEHVDMDGVAISFSQARKRVDHGLHASLTPMRFEGGALTGIQHGRRYQVQRLYDQRQREMLYILSFYLPRFMNVGFREKLATIIHELWHISPQFNGDLRRHAGRCYAHSHSQAQYDAQMVRLADRYLSLSPPEPLLSFLHETFDQLHRRTGRVFGTKIPRPKLIEVV